MKGKTTFLAKAFLMLFALLCSFTVARAEELTVYEDATGNNNYVPVYGFYADAYNKCEFVIPANELEDMTNGTISKMTFYLSTPAAEAWTGTFQVFLKEVSDATISAFSGTTDATVVYEGTLDGTQSTMTIEFSADYKYEGRNLLVGVYETASGSNYKSATFTGAAVEGASISGYSYNSLDACSATQRNFIPKTTFTYTPGEAPAVARPKNVTITYDGGLEAIVSWESTESAWDIDVNGTITENVSNPKTLTDLEYATIYTVKVRAKNGTEVSDWSVPATFNTELSDDMCQIQLVLSDAYGDGWNGGGALKIVDALSGIVIGTYSVTSEAGKNPVTITVEVPNNRDIQFIWVAGSYNYECGYVVTDVNGEVLLEHEGNSSSTEGTNPTPGVLLTWRVECTVTPWRAPSDLAASEITGTTAKLSWTENSLTPATAWVVAFKAEGETEFGEEEADSNPYVLEGLSPETKYIVKVRPASDEVEKWSDEISFTTDVAFPAPKDLAVAATSRTANISWTGNADSYTLRYRKVVTGAEMTTNFDDSSLGEWTTIDADGDGYGWVLGSACGGVYLAEGGSLANNGHNDSADLIVSGSFTNVTQAALTPDNWLVSPKVTLGGRISFWAKGQDAGYADEVFGVAVSTTSNTEPTAFTMVGASKTATGEWTQYSFSLDEYSGEGYIAIRHFNCTDKFMLDIDDIVITEPAESAMPWNVVEDLDVTSYELTELEPATEYEVGVKAFYDTDESAWESTNFTTDIATPAPTELAVSDITSSTAEITWESDPAATGATLQYAEGNVFGTSLQYDDGKQATNIGGSSSSTWTWGVMYPGSMVNASKLTKVSIYEGSYNTGDITITIYQGGSDAPETQLYTEIVTPGAAQAFHEVTLATPVDITPGENLWITLTETGTYVLAACNTTEPNNQWVENGGTWANIGSLASSLAGYGWMIRADINDGIDPSTVTWTTVADVTSPYELTGLTPDTSYTIQVQNTYAEGTSQWTTTTFTTLNANPVPYNIAADLAADGGTLTWKGEGGSYNLRYRTAAFIDASFYDGFNDLGQWTIYTEGEGTGWVISEYGATAYSYDNDTYSAWDADNWLVSPRVNLRGTLQFYDSTASDYPDSYEVRLSLTGNSIADFNNGIVLRDMAEAGNEAVSIDLSTYEGQQGYIAIHHVSKDCFILAIPYIGIFGDGDVAAGEWQTMTVTETTATISGLATNNAYEVQIQSVQGTDESEWCDAFEFALLSLDSNADNNAALLNYGGMQAHVTLANRTLVQNGTWNTLCLPFSLSAEELAASPLAGADFRTLEGIDVTSTSVTLNFSAQGDYDSYGIFGTFPWIVKWESGSGIVNPQFANVTLYSSLNNLSYSDAASGYGITFKGTYAKQEFTADNPSVLFVGADNKLYYPLAGAKVGAFRGYFELEGFTMDEGSGVKIFTNLDDEDATGIANVEKIEENTDWYDLSGRKLAGKPSVKGIYVNGGRKVTVK